MGQSYNGKGKNKLIFKSSKFKSNKNLSCLFEKNHSILHIWWEEVSLYRNIPINK